MTTTYSTTTVHDTRGLWRVVLAVVASAFLVLGARAFSKIQI